MKRFRGILFFVLFLPVFVMGVCSENEIRVNGEFVIRSNTNIDSEVERIKIGDFKCINFIDKVHGVVAYTSNIWYKINYNNADAYIHENDLSNEKNEIDEKLNKIHFSDLYFHNYRNDIISIMNDGIVDKPNDNALPQNYMTDGTTTKEYRFFPDHTINRAEFTKIVLLAKYSEEEIDASRSQHSFDDVHGEWFSKYIHFAATHPNPMDYTVKKIIKGYDNGTFQPAKKINFAEASKIIVNTLLSEIPLIEIEGTEYYIKYKNILIRSPKLMAFFEPSFSYKREVTRGEMAFLINTVLEALELDENAFEEVESPVVVVPDPVECSIQEEARTFQDKNDIEVTKNIYKLNCSPFVNTHNTSFRINEYNYNIDFRGEYFDSSKTKYVEKEKDENSNIIRPNLIEKDTMSERLCVGTAGMDNDDICSPEHYNGDVYALDINIIPYEDELGSDIYPILGGTVSIAEDRGWGYGNEVIITHPNNFKSHYAHLSSLNVNEGDVVNINTSLGIIGSTGGTFPIHLHISLKNSGNNPLIMSFENLIDVEGRD